MANVAIAGFFILVIAGGVGFGVASADSSDDLARAGAFGFDEATHAATLVQQDGSQRHASSGGETVDQSVLASAPSRDISAGLKMVDEREVAEKARVEEENAAAIVRVENQKAMQGVVAEEDEKDSASETDQPLEYDLPKVDWSVGKEAFISEWTQRIDSYLAGTELEGHGSTFAEAAWDNGVDPRWSPAISNTESTNGAHCFLPHNAWGWGQNSWSDWDSAIRDHVAGLAAGYGYSVTLSAAQMYCPPNYVHWYNNTISQMALI